MRLDTRNFPIVWMREHVDGEGHDEEEEQERMLGLLRRGERFVLVAERMPRVADLAEIDPEERRRRALLFKAYKGELARLCAGMILIGRAADMPFPVRKAIEGMSSAFGIGFLFAENETAALALAAQCLGA